MRIAVTAIRSAALAGSVLFAASAAADMHHANSAADTSYHAFFRMDESQRIVVIADEMERLFEQVRQEDRQRELCIVELFAPTGEGGLAPGFRAVIDAIEFDGNRQVPYEHDQTVEDVVAKMIEVHCPAPS